MLRVLHVTVNAAGGTGPGTSQTLMLADVRFQGRKSERAPTSWLCLFAQAAPRLPQAVTYAPAGTSAKLGANHQVPTAIGKSSRPAGQQPRTPLRRMERPVGQKAGHPSAASGAAPGKKATQGKSRRYSLPPTFSWGSGEHKVPAGPASPSIASSGHWLGPGCPPWCRTAELPSVAGKRTRREQSTTGVGNCVGQAGWSGDFRLRQSAPPP